ncbi:MAG: cytochrome C [Gammaproteobacteria bacterium]|nr:MAG: cytochrome C [Gammaproteobacteria bacterium]
MVRILLTFAMVLAVGAPAFAVTFDHAAHDGYVKDAACTTCHVEDAVSIVPAKKVCQQCHDAAFAEDVEYPSLTSHGPLWAFDHRAQAKGEAINCAQCHEQDFCLECHSSAGRADEMGELGNNLANVHRGDFQVSHPIAARTDPQLCSSCHETSFCNDCHDSFARRDLRLWSHRRGFSEGTSLGLAHAQFNETQCDSCHRDSLGGLVLPSSTNWSVNHAREARKNLATCQACHPDGDICLKCHSTKSGLRVNPHPADWSDISGRLERASGGRTCRRCH